MPSSYEAPSSELNGVTANVETDEETPGIHDDRGQWGSKWEFLLSCVGLSVGLGNVWRFPYLAYQYGGAAFLIAYLILQILIGKPMYMMELVMGQYSGRGPTAVWAMNPSAKGVGISMALISLIVAIYYNVIMAYTLYYFFASMQKTLPWTVCKDEWLPLGCVEKTQKQVQPCTGNSTIDLMVGKCLCNTTDDSFNSQLAVNCTNTTNVAVSELYFDDALLISIMDVVTSIIAGFVIFTTFGGMAKKLGVEVKDVAKGGYGLAFIAYPEALTSLPPPQLWSILFFFMLFTLGLDSEFALLETVMTCIQDEYPKLRKYKSHMCVGFGVALYLIALPCVTPAGDYIVTLMDAYGADFSVLFVATCECIGVMWVYGVNRFIADCTYMLGHPPRPIIFWAVCWAGCAPLLIGALFLYKMVKFTPPKISKDVPYPEFAQGIGWALTIVVLLPIPITFVYKFIRAEGGLIDRLREITTPDADWGPNDGSDKRPLQNTFEMERKYGLDNPGAVNSNGNINM
ncbi:S6A14-like protein [Mya arenaria]|uniref:Transporter n=1 Tax=Mya arenaria TaxID=6604 RepID=A0ABY7EYR2_MYAAR|nr:S6A14-like protein [Mya arenaria]